jgi:hypothetical protein
MTPTRNKATPELGAHGAILVAFAHARRWSPGTVPADRPAGTPWTIGAELLVADLEGAKGITLCGFNPTDTVID